VAVVPIAAAASPVSTAQEFGAARKVAARAGKVVSRVFLEARLGRAIGSSAVEPVIDDIYASIQRNLYAFNGLLRCQQDSAYVYRHSLAVSALMIALARQMKLSPTDMREAGMAGLLMDIGVGQLPVDLKATDGDYRGLPSDILNQHVVLGHALLKAAGDMPERVLHVILRHHERLDGGGYPHGLQGADIDLFSRMAAVCDSYDNLVSGGGGQPALDPAAAVRALQGMVGAIDGEVLNAFIAAVGVYPIGSLVRLRSERLAMVVDEDPDDSTLPTVRTFWSLIEGRRLRGETIALARCYGEDEIVGIADLAGTGVPDVDDLRAAILAAAGRDAAP
jgi:putative nucleotidyltransferase with HDIG domain